MPENNPLTLQEAIRAITSTPRMHRASEAEPEDNHGPEPAKVFEDRKNPGQWRVEGVDDEGRSEVENFTGPTARRDALRYAMQTYGHFREVQLEPHSSDYAQLEPQEPISAVCHIPVPLFYRGITRSKRPSLPL